MPVDGLAAGTTVEDPWTVDALAIVDRLVDTDGAETEEASKTTALEDRSMRFFIFPAAS